MKQPTNPKPTSLVLVVDDDRAMRKLLRMAIEKEGYRVIDAKNGEECLDKYQQFLPDLVLLDAIMPEIDGFACCQRLRSLKDSTHLPILMITSLDDQESIDQAFKVGATDYITKPIYWTVLSHRVNQLLQTSQSLKQFDCLQGQWERHQQWHQFYQQVAQSLSYPFSFQAFVQETITQLRTVITAERIGLHQVDGTLKAEVMHRGYPSVKTLSWKYLTLLEQHQTTYQKKQWLTLDLSESIALPDEILGCFEQLMVKTVTLMPIFKREELWGILWIHHCQESYHWEPWEESSLWLLGDLLAIACNSLAPRS